MQGEDEFDDTADSRNDSANDDKVFWWDGWPKAGKNNGEALQDIGKEKVDLKETELLVGGRYALASDLIRLQHTGCWSTGLSLTSTSISDVVKGETVKRTTCWTTKGNSLRWEGDIAGVVLGALFVALVRLFTRWRWQQLAQSRALTRHSTRWRCRNL